MDNNIFRQKNIDKINSPESLNEYIKVTNPSVWIILVGVILLIIGALVFGTIGKIDTNINSAVEVSGGIATLYIGEEDIDKVKPDMTVKIDGTDYKIMSIASRPLEASGIDSFVLHKGNLEESEWLYPITLEGVIEDGVYNASITIERVSPISYILN